MDTTIIKKRGRGVALGSKMTIWDRAERRNHAKEVCRFLLSKGYPADGWEPPKGSKSQGAIMQDIFDAAQRKVLPSERWRTNSPMPGNGQRRGFNQFWKAQIEEVNDMIGPMERELKLAEEHAAHLNGNGIAASPEKVLEAAQAEPDKNAEPGNPKSVDEMTREEMLAHATGFLDMVPGGLLLEAVIARFFSGRAKPSEPQKIEINVSADVAQQLKAQADFQALMTEEWGRMQKQVRDLSDKFDSWALNQGSEAALKPKIKRVAFCGAHKSQFLRIESDLRGYGLPISLFFVDTTKNPHQLFADYVLCTSEIGHKWTNAIESSVGRGRMQVHVHTSEKARDLIKLWLAESN
jgi:hypothetical protein